MILASSPKAEHLGAPAKSEIVWGEEELWSEWGLPFTAIPHSGISSDDVAAKEGVLRRSRKWWDSDEAEMQSL